MLLTASHLSNSQQFLFVYVALKVPILLENSHIYFLFSDIITEIYSDVM